MWYLIVGMVALLIGSLAGVKFGSKIDADIVHELDQANAYVKTLEAKVKVFEASAMGKVQALEQRL